MQRLILVRHCEAVGQQPGDPLTPAGEQQALSLSDFLVGYPVDAVFVSEYLRARQSAEPLASSLGLTVQVDARLNERVLSLTPIDNWREIVRDSFDDPQLRVPGGESADDVLQRAWESLRELLESDSRLPVVVTHGNLMSLVLNSIDGSFGYDGWANLSNPDVYCLKVRDDGGMCFERLWI